MVIDPMLGVKKNEFLSLENLAPLMEGEIRRGVVLGLVIFLYPSGDIPWMTGDMKLKRE